MKRLKRALAFLLVAVLMVATSACDSSSDSEISTVSENTITIYDGEFAEMQVIHQMVKLLVEEHTDAKVEIKEQMSPINCYKELVKGNVDLMNSYDGTLLTTYLHLDPSDVPEGQSLYDYANEQAESEGVQLLDKLGINNTYIYSA